MVLKQALIKFRLCNLLIINYLFLVLPAYSQNTISMSGKWPFKIDPLNKGEEQKWWENTKVFLGSDSIAVPGNCQLYTAYTHYAGKAWYLNEFKTPQFTSAEEVIINFESVFHDCKVWLNGKYLGDNSGFFSFSYPITDILNKSGSNTLIVMADNTFRIGAMWNWGGIRRPVTLKILNKVNVDKQHITGTPNLGSGGSNVLVKSSVYNHALTPARLHLNLKIKLEGMEIVKASKTVSVGVNDTLTEFFNFNLDKKQTFLWHFDRPNIYDAELTVTDESNKVVAAKKSRFGIRKLEIKGTQMHLNGEPVKLMGYNYVPDDRITGNTFPEWRYKKDIDMMKEAGANMARFSHLPLPEEVLDYLDEKGIMHYAEIPLWGSPNSLVNKNELLPKIWLTKLVNSQFNHPAIIGWSVGNEIGNNPGVTEYVKDAINFVRTRLDTTRLVSDVNYSAGKNDNDPAQFAEMILYNMYGAKWLKYNINEVYKRYPKPLFMAEFGDALNEDEVNLGILPLKAMVDSMRKLPYLTGASLWTFNDYRSSYQHTAENWSTKPSENRAWGIVNVHRHKKKAYYEARREFGPVEALNAALKSDKIEVSIMARPKGGLPSFTLQSYYLVVKAYTQTGKQLSSKVLLLPVLKPGDPVYQALTKAEKGAAWYQVVLYNPVQYNVADITIYIKPPLPVSITEIQSDKNSARVFFDKKAGTLEVVAKYIDEEVEKYTEPSITNYIDIPYTKTTKQLKVELIAANGAGKSTNNKTISLSPAYGTKPHNIYEAAPVQDGFMLGYYSDKRDYMYQVEYFILPDTLKVYQYQTQARGVLSIKDIPEGKTVRYRFRSLAQTFDPTDWTNYKTVNAGFPKGEKELQDVKADLVKAESKKAQDKNLEKKWFLNDKTGNREYNQFWNISFPPEAYAKGYHVVFYKGNEIIHSIYSDRNTIDNLLVPVTNTQKADKVKVIAVFE